MRTPFGTLIVTLLVVALAVSLAPSGAAGGSDESIEVSGHWVVEVRDPDGTPVMRREFHNALHPDNPIARLLTGQRTPGPLRVLVACGSGCPPPCGPPAGSCVIYEARERFSNPVFRPSSFDNLDASSGDVGLQLRGFAVASNDTTVNVVSTEMVICPGNSAPTFCRDGRGTGNFFKELTATVLSPGIPVAAGQQVLVTVTITAATGVATPQNGASSR